MSRPASAALLAVLLLTAGCGVFDRAPTPPCPPVLVVNDASRLTVYRDGPGRDVTDVDFSARIANFTGGCEWNRARTVADVELRILFEVERGPANRNRAARYSYFVAVPAFHPAPEGKQVFAGELTFPENVMRSGTGDTVRVRVPIARDKRWEDYPIYLGFQITPEQAEDNRRRRAR